MNDRTTQSDTRQAGETRKAPGLKWEVVSVACAAAIAAVTWLFDFNWGFHSRLLSWVPWPFAILVSAARYTVLPVLLVILSIRFYFYWPRHTPFARTVRFLLLAVMLLFVC